MNFFRLRLLNTFLVLLAGIMLGVIYRGGGRKSAPPQPAQRYQPEYEAAAAPGENPAEEAGEEEEPAEEEPAPAPAKPAARGEPAQPVLELETGESAALTPLHEQFFRKPEKFAGSRVELKMQIIAAQKKGEGWRLNFVHTGKDRSIHYLYVDDQSRLGPAPDLKVGYFYSVRFDCAGDAAEGNTLVSLAPTGEKADWATGLSAVE